MLACTACRTGIPVESLDPAGQTRCRTCNTPLSITLFPACFTPPSIGASGESLTSESEAGCFFHPGKKAAVPCDACGRFLCALCDFDLGDRHLCASCIESGRRKGTIVKLENQRTLYDRIALALATLPLLLFYFTVFSAPAAIYVGVRYWNAPGSLVHRSKVRLVVAIGLAALEIAGWILLFAFLAGRWRTAQS